MQSCRVVCHLISDDTANLHVCGVISCVSKSNKSDFEVKDIIKCVETSGRSELFTTTLLKVTWSREIKTSLILPKINFKQRNNFSKIYNNHTSYVMIFTRSPEINVVFTDFEQELFYNRFYKNIFPQTKKISKANNFCKSSNFLSSLQGVLCLFLLFTFLERNGTDLFISFTITTYMFCEDWKLSLQR